MFKYARVYIPHKPKTVEELTLNIDDIITELELTQYTGFWAVSIIYLF